MSRSPMRSLLATLFFVFGTVAAPLADALVFHHDGAHGQIHIEAADADDCHGERCALGSPQPPLSSAVPQTVPAQSVAQIANCRWPATTRLIDFSPSGPHGSRAPPSLT